MLTFTGKREIAGCDVYRDDADPLAWYLLPQAPRLAFDGEKPIFSLVWYRRDISAMTEEQRRTRLGGGILTLSVDLSPTEEQEAAIREAIGGDETLQRELSKGPFRKLWMDELKEDPQKLAAAIKLGNVPVRDGTVTVAVLAEPSSGDAAPAGAEFVASFVGAGRVNTVGRHRASFMAKLTQDGAVLLWKMLEKDLAAIYVGYDLRVAHRLDGVRMVVWCDAEKAYHAVQSQWAHITDDASWSVRHDDKGTHYRYSHEQTDDARNSVFSAVTASEASGVEIIPEEGGDTVSAETMTELTRTGNEMLKDFLASTFLTYDPGADATFEENPTLETELAAKDGKKYGHHGITRYHLNTWNETMKAELNYEFRSQVVLESHLSPGGTLPTVLGETPVEQIRTQVEIDAAWYRYLDVQVVCTTDFDDDPVDLVTAHLHYKGTGSQGSVDKSADFIFKKGQGPQHFATYLADPSQKTYDYKLDVRYKGSQEVFTLAGKSDESVLVLDTDRCGVLAVEVQMGIIDWQRIRQVLVKMSYGAGAARKETEFSLDAQKQSHRWVVAIGVAIAQPYSYEVTYIDATGQRLEGPVETSRSPQLVLNQPLREELEVVLVPAGSFGAGGLLSQVVVSVRYKDEPNDYLVDETFTFTKEGESKIWKVPLVNKVLRAYEYLVKVFYSDGVTREEEWRTTDTTILAVGDPYGWRVQILPYLLKDDALGYQFATIHLSFDDTETGIHAEKTLDISDFSKPLTFRFRLGSPSRHTYRYQLTLFGPGSRVLAMPEAEESREVLVLLPPAPAPADPV